MGLSGPLNAVAHYVVEPDADQKNIGNGQWRSYCVASFVGLNMTKCTALMTCHWRWTFFEPLAPGTMIQVAISKRWLKSTSKRTGLPRFQMILLGCVPYGPHSSNPRNPRRILRRRWKPSSVSSIGGMTTTTKTSGRWFVGKPCGTPRTKRRRRCDAGGRPSGFIAKLAKWVNSRMKLLYIYIYIWLRESTSSYTSYYL